MRRNPLAILMILMLFLAASSVLADDPTTSSNARALDTVWMLIAAFLVFFMQAGFGFRALHASGRTCTHPLFADRENRLKLTKAFWCGNLFVSSLFQASSRRYLCASTQNYRSSSAQLMSTTEAKKRKALQPINELSQAVLPQWRTVYFLS